MDDQLAGLRDELSKYIESDSSFDTKLRFLKHLVDENGNIIKACSLTGVRPSVVAVWKLNDAVFKQQCDRIALVSNDVAESALLDLVEGRDVTSVKFYLERRMPEKYGQNIMTTNVNVDVNNTPISKCSTDNLKKIRSLLNGDTSV